MKPIKYVVLFLLVGLAIFYYEKSFIPLTLDSENRKLGDVLAAYVPLVFVLAPYHNLCIVHVHLS